MQNDISPETDILIDAHITPVKPAVIEDNAGPREKNNDDEKLANEEDGIVNDDNEEGEGISYDDDDAVANPQKDDEAEEEEKNIDADSEVHEQNPKENSF